MLGLFKDRAVLRIDGRRQVVAAGETTADGVRVVSADSEKVVLVIDGERQERSLDSRIGGRYAAPERATVTLWPDRSGMYPASGQINGHSVGFLVDTGATLVALGTDAADRMGIDYRRFGVSVPVGTAGGTVTGFRVTLDSVKLGRIEQRNVPAVVIEGAGPGQVLLGMSFLSRVRMERSGRALQLQQRW